MKSITEFWSFALTQGLKIKEDLTAEGKTLEEIQVALGEKHKLEGDKLAHFINALEVATQNIEKLSRVLVVSLSEGENAPAKAVKLGDHHYVPEFQVAPKPISHTSNQTPKKGGGRGKKDRKGAPKESPWGLSPEQKAAKKGGGTKAEKTN